MAIEVIEAVEVERATYRVHCEFCGKDSTMELIKLDAGGEEKVNARLPICCEETARRVNQGSTGQN